MDSIISAALEEICARAAGGIPLLDLWPTLTPSFLSSSLPSCDAVKKAIWRRLLALPVLRFESNGAPLASDDPSIQSLDGAERLGLRIVAVDHLRNSFLGLYDLIVPDKRPLERIAAARTNGITQCELGKEFDVKGNNMFYIVRKLESQQLIVRQSTIVKTKESGWEGANELKNTHIMNTNLIHLYRYAKTKNSNPQQRIEITRPALPDMLEGIAYADTSSVTGDVASGERVKEDVLIKDYLPEMKAICDKLEAASEKVLTVSSIKLALDYRNSTGHRAWRNILNRLKDAGLVEEIQAEVNKKDVRCLRLLKKFDPKVFPSKNMSGYDGFDSEQVKHGKRGQINDQLVELPIEYCVYDIVDAEGPKGLTISEVCKRLGLNPKKMYTRIIDMFSRFGMCMKYEIPKRTPAVRLWTHKNYQLYSSAVFPGNCEAMPDKNELCTESRNFVSCDQSSPNFKQLDSCSHSEELHIDKANSGENGMGTTTPCLELPADSQIVVYGTESKNLIYKCSAMDTEVKDGDAKIVTESDVFPSERLLSVSSTTKKQNHSFRSVASTVVAGMREQRIIEKLENEKFVLVSELYRWLEDLEEDKHTTMDRKTLARILNKLQQEGYCRIIKLTFPGLTNIHRHRETRVILHHSIQKESSDLFPQIYKRLRSFDIQSRGHGSAKSKNTQVTSLKSMKKHSKRMDKNQSAMHANGFVTAKMVRAKLLHKFLWSYLSNLFDWQNTLNSRKYEYDRKNPCSTCRLFALDAAIKALSLELFLQIVGCNKEINEMVDKCKKGLRLSDLSVQEYKYLMDTRATGRLSSVVDILLRLKLIQLVREGLAEDMDVTTHAVLTHAMELQPYIEEPLPKVLPSNVSASDLHSKVRHDFFLSNLETVDEYWETLEYCYSKADSAASSHAFPGSAVREVCHPRSWASVRVMTAEQRMELLKRVKNDDPVKKIPFKERVKIARELNLTLEQVQNPTVSIASASKSKSFRSAFYDKSQSKVRQNLSGSKSKKREKHVDTNTCEVVAQKRRKLSKDEAVEPSQEDTGFKESHRPTMPVTLCADEEHMDLNSLVQIGSETNDNDLQASMDNRCTNATAEIEPCGEDGENFALISQCAFPREKPTRRERQLWNDNLDRQLVMQYARHRATLGVRFYRVDWTSLSDLPASPNVCARRMAALKTNVNVRKAVMRLCNLLGERYSTYLDKTWRMLQKETKNSFGSEKSTHGVMVEKSTSRTMSTNHDNNSESSSHQDCWDDFENPDIKDAVDEVLRCKRIKTGFGKKGGSTKEKGRPGIQPSRGKFSSLLNSRYISIRRQVCHSLAVANAVELLKLLFLSNSADPKVQASLTATLKLYSEGDLFAAINYLKEKKFMVSGNGSRPHVLSRKFLDDASSSPFPIGSGKRAANFLSWLHKHVIDLTDNGVNLSSDLQCGEIFQLLALVSSGEVSISPSLPEEGVGEADDSKNLKFVLPVDGTETDRENLKRTCDIEIEYSAEKVKRHKGQGKMDGNFCCRREKGFPGIKVYISHAAITCLIDEERNIYSLSSNKMCKEKSLKVSKNAFSSSSINQSSSHNFGGYIPSALFPNESSWDAMARYATSDGGNNSLCPELFKSVHFAICQAGEQGLNMEEISRMMDVQGVQLAEIVVDSLEVFQLAIKVNAYDCVRVVDSLYRPKFFISSISEHNQDDFVASYMKKDLSCEASPQILPSEHDNNYDLRKYAGTKIYDGHKVGTVDFPTKFDPSCANTQSSEDSAKKCKQGEVILVQDIEDGNSTYPATDVSHVYQPILPWINGDGSTNTIVYKGLMRRILGTLMQNPGISEEDIICRMDVLNPQSCRRLLEAMVLDNHITTRTRQTAPALPPAILQNIFSSDVCKLEPVFQKHYFANPMSTFLL